MNLCAGRPSTGSGSLLMSDAALPSESITPGRRTSKAPVASIDPVLLQPKAKPAEMVSSTTRDRLDEGRQERKD